MGAGAAGVGHPVAGRAVEWLLVDVVNKGQVRPEEKGLLVTFDGIVNFGRS